MFSTTILSGIGVYGIATLIAEYDGPLALFVRLRNVAKVTRCNVCLAVWLGIPVALLANIGVLGYLATIGIVILTERLT